MHEELRQQLEKLIHRQSSHPCQVTDLVALSGGANNVTMRFAVPEGGAQGRYILRLAYSADGEGMDKKVEAQVQQAAGDAGVPIAEVRWLVEPEDNMGSGYIMACIEGETIARKILRNEEFGLLRPRLAALCGEYAARIHSLAPSRIPLLTENNLATQLAYYQQIYQASKLPRPVFELAFHWLQSHRPEPVPARIVHGDFRNGNFIIGAEGIRAILDWELAHLGDPMEDLAWLCVNSWRFGNRGNPVGGFGHREDLFSSYQSYTGVAIDRARVHYWEVMGTLKWGLMCTIMSADSANGDPLSVERAAIGRRCSETEIDLLELLAGDN